MNRARLEQAVDWMVRLRAAGASTADRGACAAWRASDPACEQAWQAVAAQLEQTFGSLREIDTRRPGEAGELRRLLLRPRSRRRFIGEALGLAAVGVGGGIGAVALQRSAPLGGWLADLHTATGERRQLTLADGSTIVLDARTVIDLDFAAGRRRIRLREGALIAEVGGGSPLPLVIATAQGSVAAAENARIMVRQGDGRSRAAALAHGVELAPAEGRPQLLAAGRSAWYDAQRVIADAAPAGAEAAWASGRLEVQDRPLGEVVAALRPYRRGFLRVSPDAARLRVQGSFPLDDSDAVLAALAETLPIRVERHGAWLVLIDIA
jgi:transmembrane sensor